MADMPRREHDIDADLVRALLADQHPDLGGLPLRRAGHGWDNEIYRLGEDLAVRMPRRAAAAELVRHEQRWLPELARRLPVAVPAPVRVGAPGRGYPWSWSIVPWLTGATWDDAPPPDAARAARDLGRFVHALHTPAPADAPVNPFRGVPLADRAERFDQHVGELGGRIDARRCRSLFAELVTTPPWPGPAVWVHGDLHPLNLLVESGRLAAVIDFGDLCGGDPATDLAVAWIALPAPARSVFRAAAGVDHDTWRRARAWALVLALAYLAGADDHPTIAAVGRRALTEVLAE